MPRFLFEYLDGGALSETTLKANEADFAELTVRQRVLRDVSNTELGTDLFGARASMPLALSPVGMAGMYARRGEARAAEAAAAAGVPFTLSTVSICDLEEVQGASGRPAWFQLYVTKDRGFMRAAIERAAALGASALVITVDMVVPGQRHRDLRSGLSGARGWRQTAGLYAQALRRPRWTWDVGLRGRPHSFGTVAASAAGDFGLTEFWIWMAKNFDATVSWRDLESIRSLWTGPLIVKGLLDADDARAAVAAGSDGLVVSNHGGRQLDGAPSSIRALPAIRDAVGGDATLLLDGGVRSGVDIFRALAMGADAAMIGRPWVYALAAGGRAGVEAMLDKLRVELATTMALAGTPRLTDIKTEALRGPIDWRT